MNAKMIDAALGMVARFIPPEEYAKAVKAITELSAIAQSFDDRLKEIQAMVEVVKAQQDRIEMLETIVRNNVPGAETEFSARDMFMVPGTIEAAMAPSKGVQDEY